MNVVAIQEYYNLEESQIAAPLGSQEVISIVLTSKQTILSNNSCKTVQSLGRVLLKFNHGPIKILFVYFSSLWTSYLDKVSISRIASFAVGCKSRQTDCNQQALRPRLNGGGDNRVSLGWPITSLDPKGAGFV